MAHILLIEPDALLANTYQQALAAAGQSVEVASSAQQAVHAADERKPDVVVLELQLRGHNGLEFLYELRSYHEWLGIPIIVHSFVPASEFVDSSVLYNELGVRQYLYKPTTSLSSLVHSVQALTPAL